jgi:hypothetical protein
MKKTIEKNVKYHKIMFTNKQLHQISKNNKYMFFKTKYFWNTFLSLVVNYSFVFIVKNVI